MDDSTVPWALFGTGSFLLLGYAVHVLARRAHVPRVTLLLLMGVLIGPSGLGLVPESAAEWFPTATLVALSIVGFTLGEEFLGRKVRSLGRVVLGVGIAETLGAAVGVFALLLAVGTPPVLALLLAGIAPASAPAATVDVIHESRSKGPLTATVLGVVAIDDAFGILLFSLLLAGAQMWSASGAPGGELLLAGLWEIGGAILLGVSLGVPMAWLTGRIRKHELNLIEGLGFIFLCAGLAELIGVSYLFACITLGAVVANLARHHKRPFHAIEGISQPFLVLFFLLAGFELDLASLPQIGLIGGAYVVGRSAGLILGGAAGAHLADASPAVRRYAGWCLLPQAGVALGLGLMAAQRFPDYGDTIMSLLVGTTFAFEIFGPLATRFALQRAGEADGGRPKEKGS